MELLGFVSAKPATTTYTVFDNILGGNLLPLSKRSIPTPVRCRICHKLMCFLSQMYCPLTASSRHRVLFFFICLSSECQTQGYSWKAFRSEEEAEETIKHNNDIGGWTLGSDDDNEIEADCFEDGPCLVVEEALNSGCFSEPTSQEQESLPGPFQCHFIDVYDSETQLSEVVDDVVNDERKASNWNFETWLQTYEIDEAFIDEDDNTGTDTFHGDLSNYFALRNACEDIRYSWNGHPLFNGRPPDELSSRLVCPRCGSQRVFELQIFPTINNSLKLIKNVGGTDRHSLAPMPYDLPKCNDGLDSSWLLRFVTVLLFSCSNSCWKSTDSYIEECLVVQAEGGQNCISDTGTA